MDTASTLVSAVTHGVAVTEVSPEQILKQILSKVLSKVLSKIRS
jgi:hypothetical protein